MIFYDIKSNRPAIRVSQSGDIILGANVLSKRLYLRLSYILLLIFENLQTFHFKKTAIACFSN